MQGRKSKAMVARCVNHGKANTLINFLIKKEWLSEELNEFDSKNRSPLKAYLSFLQAA